MPDHNPIPSRAALAAMRASREAYQRAMHARSEPQAHATTSAYRATRERLEAHWKRVHAKSVQQPTARPAEAQGAPAQPRLIPRDGAPIAVMQLTAAAPRSAPEPPHVAAHSTLTQRLDALAAQNVQRLREAKRESEPISRPASKLPRAVVAIPKEPQRDKQPFVPWREFQAARTGVDPGPNAGVRTLLLVQPATPPQGWVPRVHGLAGEPRELCKRALEASRIAPIFTLGQWALALEEPESELRRWPANRRLTEQLDAVARAAGHARLASMRCQLHALNAFAIREFGARHLEVFETQLSVTRLRAYLRERDDASLLRKKAAKASQAPARAGGEDPEDGGGAAAAALSLLELARKTFRLPWATDSAQLDEFRGRPLTREEGGAMGAEITHVLHCEYGAADPSLNEFERGCMALAAMQAHTCLRAALANRSRRPQRVENDMAIGAAGMDLKKGVWRSAGRPLICSTLGYSGSDAWFERAALVLDAGDFNARQKSLLRAHNGRDGNPRLATAWLDVEPTESEWNRTLAHLWKTEVTVVGGDGVRNAVVPHLAPPEAPSGRVPTKHSLKTVKPSAYVALRLHPHYAVEATAHSGSAIERLSVGAMAAQTRALAPKGLAIALRYARGAYSETSLAETDHLVFRAVRQYVTETGLSNIPRRDSWAALMAWANTRAFEREMRPLTIAYMAPKPPEPPLPDSVEELAAEPAEDPEVVEVEVEVDMAWDLQ